MHFGKIIGAIIGGLTFQFPGAVIGFIAGYFFDKGLTASHFNPSPEEQRAIEKAFFDSLFPILGKLSKADGRISEEEIAGTEALMAKMGLNTEARKVAIENFKAGAQPEYVIDDVLTHFLDVCGHVQNFKHIFLVYLITIAYADGELHENEEQLLQEVADKLGYSRFGFNHLMGMVRAQTHFYRGQQDDAGYRYSGASGGGVSSKDEIRLAYEALGVEESIDDKELKRAYRKLMSENHPDKLAGRGVPEDMVKLATERSQEIQAAYDLLKKHRA